MTLAGIRQHQQAFQAIADANDGIRLAGTAGYDDSAQYGYDKMAAAGFNVSFQEFELASSHLITASNVGLYSGSPSSTRFPTVILSTEGGGLQR